MREGAALRAAGGPAIESPYDDPAYQVGEALARVTDAQVSAVRVALGSDKAAFEIVISACIGAASATRTTPPRRSRRQTSG